MIKIIAPAGPGGDWDPLARTVQKVLTEEKLVDQPILVTNKPGGGGASGWGYLKRLPAAFLIAGVLASGLCHYLGLVAGRPPSAFLLAGFVVTGSVVGARFTRIPLADLRRLFGAAIAGVVVSSILAALFALIAARALSFPFGQLLIAYAPGGVEAMAAMALSLDYDSAFVATHHLFRIILLLFVLPLLLKVLRGKVDGTVGEVYR